MTEFPSQEIKNFSTMSVKSLNYYRDIVGIGAPNSEGDTNTRVNFIIGNNDGTRGITYMTAKSSESDDNPNGSEVDFSGLLKSNQMNVGLGGVNVEGDLLCEGDITAEQISTASDRTKKKNIEKCENSLEILDSIEGVTWNWKKNNNKSSGVIADDLKKNEYLSYMVKGKKGSYTVDYNNFHGYYIEAIKELNQKIEILNIEINRLKNTCV